MNLQGHKRNLVHPHLGRNLYSNLNWIVWTKYLHHNSKQKRNNTRLHPSLNHSNMLNVIVGTPHQSYHGKVVIHHSQVLISSQNQTLHRLYPAQIKTQTMVRQLMQLLSQIHVLDLVTLSQSLDQCHLFLGASNNISHMYHQYISHLYHQYISHDRHHLTAIQDRRLSTEPHISNRLVYTPTHGSFVMPCKY